MALRDKMIESSPTTGEDFSLTKQEIEWLLNLIKDSTFKGSELEKVYNSVYKLQQQFIKL